MRGELGCLDHLIAKGAKLNAVNNGGHTALDLAKGNVGRAKEKHLAVALGPLGSGFPPPRTHYQKEATRVATR